MVTTKTGVTRYEVLTDVGPDSVSRKQIRRRFKTLDEANEFLAAFDRHDAETHQSEIDRTDWWRPVCYEVAHHRVYALFGKASDHACIHCGRQAAHWAYDHMDPTALRRQSSRLVFAGLYSRFPEFYMPLCASCHHSYDAYMYGNGNDEVAL